jgi:hypothetical protein
VQTGYGEKVLEYHRWLYTEHGLPHCEVHGDISSHPLFYDGSPWSTWVIGNDMDDAMEKAAYVVLTFLRSQRLPDTTDTAIMFYPIQDHSDHEWKARIDGVCDVFQDHYHLQTAVGHSAHRHRTVLPSRRLSKGSQVPKMEIECMGRDHSTLR